MGKRDKKSGKGRLDKFYHLAKEQGYRSRAAYKLIQLNRKYDFLSKARVVIDLCAAPGGWLQVASKFTPVSSLIIGVDLDAIKPVKRAITFVDDITTQRCRKQLKSQLKTWKADVVLHDGAPNMGQNWVQDAYTQNELVLQALRLATDFLRGGGTFVTKVFRSQDYNSLLWVFNQLFKKVEATKPQASRNTSAEIFVVCQEYKAPTSIDPKMLDPVHIFQGVDKPVKEVGMETLMKEQKKKPRARGGYDEEAAKTQLLYKTRPISDFVETKEPIQFLLEVNTMTWPTAGAELRVLKSVEFYKSLPFTTPEIVMCTEDLRVLGKKDFKGLMKWRTQVREFMAEADKKEKIEEARARGEVPEEEKQPEEKDEQTKMAEELAETQKRLLLRKRRASKIRREKMAKLRQRIALNIVMPGDIIDAPTDQGLFTVEGLRDKAVDALHAASAPDIVLDADEMDEDMDLGGISVARGAFLPNGELALGFDDDDDDADAYHERMDEQLETQYEEFRAAKEKRPVVIKIGKKEKREKFSDVDLGLYSELKRKERGENVDLPRPRLEDPESSADADDAGAAAGGGDEESADDAVAAAPASGDDGGQVVPLLRRGAPAESLSKRAAMWFGQELFAGVDDDEPVVPIAGAKRKQDATAEISSAKRRRRETEDDVVSADAAAESDDDDDFTETQTTAADAAALAQGGGDPAALSQSDVDSEEFEEVPRVQFDSDEETNIECAAIAQLLLQKKQETLVDDSYNRRAFNDSDLPTWFADEEKQHNRPQIPVTKEMVKELKQLHRSINARPIAKVVEARARKRHKAMKKLEKVHKQAATLADNDDIDDKAKMKAIERLYKKGAMNKMKPGKTYVVGKRTTASNRGAGGRTKIVDRRMKADKKKGRAGWDSSKKSKKR